MRFFKRGTSLLEAERRPLGNERYNRTKENNRRYTLRLVVSLGARQEVKVMCRAGRNLLEDVPIANINQEDVVSHASRASISWRNAQIAMPRSGKRGTKPGTAPTKSGVRGCSNRVSRRGGEGYRGYCTIKMERNTGADPSVVDKGTMQAMRIPYEVREDRVYGLGRSPLVVCGTARISIDIGNAQRVDHEVDVLDTTTKTAILGRRFLALFKDTTFDWENLRVKLEGHWIPSLAAACGGQAATRAEVMRIEGVGNKSSVTGKFDINPRLPYRQRQAIQRLLEKWTGVFAENPKRPQKIKTAEHVITLLDERPVRHRPLRVSPEMEAEVSRQIDEMLGGIIRLSTSPWASRVILVKKKDGSHRFAVDYRDLNDMSKRDAYPMPDARDVFDRMGGSTIFSKLDGASAYWCIPM